MALHCDGDSCKMTTEDEDLKAMLKGLTGIQRRKLVRWMKSLDPRLEAEDVDGMDYDAPGTTTREQGV